MTWLYNCVAAGLDGIILSDYKKGVLTDSLAQSIIKEANRAGIPVLVDPKGSDWTSVRLLLADGVTAGDVSVSLELPERYVLGTSPEVYAVYTVNGGDKQESTSVRVPAVLTGLDALLEANAGRELDTASDVKPARMAGMLIAISLACTAAAAGATLCVMRVMRLRKTKKQKPSKH